MLPMRIPTVLALSGMIAACLCAWAPAASAGSPSAVEDKAVFAPIESTLSGIPSFFDGTQFRRIFL